MCELCSSPDVFGNLLTYHLSTGKDDPLRNYMGIMGKTIKKQKICYTCACFKVPALKEVKFNPVANLVTD